MSAADKSVDRMALAGQVIVSAGDVLLAAGFDPGEIAAIFREAADQIAGHTGAPAAPSPAPMSGPFAQMRSEFLELKPVQELTQIAMAPQQLARIASDDSVLRAAFDAAMKSVSRIADAQAWLRKAAQEAELSVVSDAEAVEEGKEETTLLLDEWQDVYTANLDGIAVVAQTLADRDDEEAFLHLMSELVDAEVSPSAPMKAVMEQGVATFGLRRAFRQNVMAGADGLASPEAVIERFVAAHECAHLTHRMADWLEDMATVGLIALEDSAEGTRIRVTAPSQSPA